MTAFIWSASLTSEDQCFCYSTADFLEVFPFDEQVNDSHQIQTFLHQKP